MLGAWAYIAMTKNIKKNTVRNLIFTIISISCIIIYKFMCDLLKSYDFSQKWQLDYRFILSAVFLVFIISTALSLKWYRKLWDNKLARFTSTISFNLYIWHQFISVKLKEFRIPYWDGDTPPNMTGDISWQWQYFILCIVVSVAVACFMTFCVEKPLYKLIMKGHKKCLE